ncbi:MAG: DNA/RNA nuclease SfsA [Clostridia bacterium]|nr:DNA/RNA nuclease SfsA [Clostridia bacterium]
MQYPSERIREAVFIKRINRFIAHVLLNGTEVVCHVKNTGRCAELLIPGTLVHLYEAPADAKRKTAYDLIAVRKGERLINMDSQAPNKAALSFLRRQFPSATIQPEASYGSSRMDFRITDDSFRMLVEVKGVTLERDGAVFFPDAPTQRGTKHLRELIHAKGEGYRCAVLFVIQMQDVCSFSPNDLTDPDFARTLSEAYAKGVEIWAYDCAVTPDSMKIRQPVDVLLDTGTAHI